MPLEGESNKRQLEWKVSNEQSSKLLRLSMKYLKGAGPNFQNSLYSLQSGCKYHFLENMTRF